MAADATRDLEYLEPPARASTALAALPELSRRWFVQRFAAPTPAQRSAWPAVSAGRHLLLSAPTGTGKTLAALLPIVGRFLVEPSAGGLRCLYVAPLKALLADA